MTKLKPNFTEILDHVSLLQFLADIYTIKSPPSQETNKQNNEKKITIHFNGTENNVMTQCPVSPNR